MKKPVLLMSVLLSAVLVTTGCSVNIGGSKWEGSDRATMESHEKQQRDRIARMSVGTDIETVRQEMGTPDFTEVYNQQGGKVMVLFYRTHRIKADGNTTKDECTPLVFKNNKLDSWGERALSSL